MQEPIITQRDGRYVIPLKADFKGRIRGIVHDQSASGATLFIEPLVTAPLFAGKPLIHESFWSGLPVVPVVTLAYLFNGLYFISLLPAHWRSRACSTRSCRARRRSRSRLW